MKNQNTYTGSRKFRKRRGQNAEKAAIFQYSAYAKAGVAHCICMWRNLHFSAELPAAVFIILFSKRQRTDTLF